MAIVSPPIEDYSSPLLTGAAAPARRRRPRAWLVALALASFLAPCHAPIMDAASTAFPFFCTLVTWPAG